MSIGAMVMAVGVTAGASWAQWVSIPHPGIPRTADGRPDLKAPAPRAADGKPDLSGLWMAEGQTYFMDLAAGLPAGAVEMLPWAAAEQERRTENLHGDDPLAHCLPHGVPRINTNGLFPFKIVQTPALVVILYEQLNQFRQVFLDGRQLENGANPTWLGYSTGRWEGDTLVIDTHGFNGKAWLDTRMGRPASEQLHVVERFRRPDFGDLEVVATIDDPGTYVKPWTTTVQKMRLVLDSELIEFICGENEKDAAHIVGK